jgi:hypothetical protein
MADSQLLTLMLPYSRGFAITTSDLAANNFATITRGLYVGGAGNAVVVMQDGTQLTLNGLVVGSIYALRLKRVNATGTTATNLVGLY